MRTLIFCVLFCSVLVHWGRAERFLSREQAQKILYPSAEKFEEKNLELSANEVNQLSKSTATRLSSSKITYRIAKKGDAVLGIVFFDHTLGKHELIDYAVAVSPKGEVQGVEILEYRESHGWEIRNPKWRSQFLGKNSRSKLRLHSDVYNISGATISCRAITNGVKQILAIFELRVARGLGTVGGGLQK